LKDESTWNGAFETVYMGLIISCSIISTLIAIVALLTKIAIKCKKWMCKSNQVSPRPDVEPDAEPDINLENDNINSRNCSNPNQTTTRQNSTLNLNFHPKVCSIFTVQLFLFEYLIIILNKFLTI
jgi:hypothetical protein